MAARAGQADVVRYLLKNGAKVETKSKVSTLSSRANIFVGTGNKSTTFCRPAGRPDSVTHLQSAGESRDRPTVAAVWRLCQCRHNLRLHPPSPGCPRRTPGCRHNAPGERSFTVLLHKGDTCKTHTPKHNIRQHPLKRASSPKQSTMKGHIASVWECVIIHKRLIHAAQGHNHVEETLMEWLYEYVWCVAGGCS